MKAFEFELIALSGISGSGKTTWAMEWVSDDPANRIRVNQDDIRAVLFAVPTYSKEQEAQVRTRHEEMVVAGLLAKKSVISDNTNLTAGKLQHLHDIARHHGAGFRIHRLHATFDEAKTNIAQRVAGGGRDVSINILRDQYEAFRKSVDVTF